MIPGVLLWKQAPWTVGLWYAHACIAWAKGHKAGRRCERLLHPVSMAIPITGSGLSPGGRLHDHSAQPGCIQSRFELYAGGKAASYTRQQFVSTPEHYSALFHEQKDGIGHEKRLYRRAVKAHFGIQECSKEEFLWPRSAPLLWFTRPGSLRVEQEKQPRQGLILNRNCEILTLR